jgi:hypothetical protein
MKLYTVWANNHTGINEACLMDCNGNYVGIETGTTYSKDKYYSSEQLTAKIISVDNTNKTGMLHLYAECYSNSDAHEDNKASWKRKFINCIVTIEQAHYVDALPIYRCLELNEYFSGDELEIIGLSK